MASYIPILDDIIQVKVGTFCQNQAGINVLNYKVTSVVGGGTDLAGFLQAVHNGVKPIYLTMMTNTATYYGVRGQRVMPEPVTLAEVYTNVGVGTAGATPMPLQVSGILSALTDIGGRSYRGRIYIPFPDYSDHDPATNTPSVGYNNRCDALGAVIYTPFTVTVGAAATIYTPIVYHWEFGTGTTITGRRVRDKWASQRRRGNYGQANGYPPF